MRGTFFLGLLLGLGFSSFALPGTQKAFDLFPIPIGRLEVVGLRDDKTIKPHYVTSSILISKRRNYMQKSLKYVLVERQLRESILQTLDKNCNAAVL